MVGPVAGGALLFHPQAIAQGLARPVAAPTGLLVVPATRNPVSAPFTPGTPTALHSADGQLDVTFPAGAYSRTLTLQQGYTPAEGETAPPDLAGFHRGFGTFFLGATDTQGQAVHQFAQPLTVTVHYTPQQLQALDLVDADLTLFWFDTTAQTWVPLPTALDPTTHSATATVDHFTAFQLGDLSAPSEAYMPSLQGWQVGLSTGAASYSYPLDLPAGPAGLKPGLTLSYSSAATDGKSGLRHNQQAGWVGKGWSLDTGYIGLNNISQPYSRYYSLVFDGHSYDLVRGDALVSSPTLTHPDDWDWRSTDESFIRVRAVYVGTAYGSSGSPGRGGYKNSTPERRYKWQVWMKDGTRYDFEEDAWQGWYDSAGPAAKNYTEAYKWYLTRVTDTFGNQINYTYARSNGWYTAGSGAVSGTIDWSVWPTKVEWGSASNMRYEVIFTSTIRTYDTNEERAPNALGNVAPRETQQLDAIAVWSKQAAIWEPVRYYDLTYDATPLDSDESNCDVYPGAACTRFNDSSGGSPKLALQQIQRRDKGGGNALPALTFTYGRSRGGSYYPAGSWNRLTEVNNGQGGRVVFTYDNIGAVTPGGSWEGGTSLFANYRRVHVKTVYETSTGTTLTYPWTYTYTNPALNTLGSDLAMGGGSVYPNSATLFYSTYVSDPTSYSGRLIRQPNTEFRGHSYVVEQDPNGNETEHWFYQGDVGCTPRNSGGGPQTGAGIKTNTCFQNMRDREFLKGREYKTITHQGTVSGAKLSQVDHTSTVQFLKYGDEDGYFTDDALTGLWRAFSYESQTVETAWDNGSTALSKTTDYTYESTYGNLTQLDESDASGLLRRTTHSYGNLVNATSYIVDRKRSDNVLDSGLHYLARTVYAYDPASLGDGTVNSTGALYLVRKYYDVPLVTALVSTAIHSSDTSYGYDSYGNQTTVTTYAGAGTTTYDASGTPSWGSRGGTSASRVTTTGYETTFHVFRTQVTPPITALAETAGYDYRMGTLTSVTGPNGSTTTVNAEYDGYGRLTKLWKPGDSQTYPTVHAIYNDSTLPFRYDVEQRETAGASGTLRHLESYYDGLGRLIQSKGESARDGSNNVSQAILVDKRYDGLGQLTQESQPRYASQSGATFTSYTVPGATLTNPTLTSYDGLGRPTQVLSPDLTQTNLSYRIENGYRTTTTIDARFHQTKHQSDMFGRLQRVLEYSGNNNPGGGQPNEGAYTVYGTTTYGYSPLDLLNQVTDAASNVTTMGYDTLGRKTTMHDPDMAPSTVDWTYQYDVNGNLRYQTDAKSQTITFGYDDLDRLTSKSSPGDSVSYTYDGASVPNGKGQRTQVSRTGSTYNWQYDTRGRVASADYNLSGLTTQTFQWTYDSADRVTQITYPGTVPYPTGEQVTYSYDPAGRPTQLHSVHYGVDYVSNPHYSALDQPQDWTLGNGLVQTWQYDATMARLSRLEVGTSGTPNSLLDRGYTYDNAGNVQTIAKNPLAPTETQTFTYDHRDRLTNWAIPSVVNETYGYNTIGNLTSKAGTSYSYGPRALGSGGGGPHAAITVGGQNLTYDANGNLLTGPNLGGSGTRSFTWTTDNQPASITSGGVTEQYVYDADGERISRTRSGVTTYYLGGLAEVDSPSTTVRDLYSFNGQVVAQRAIAPDPPTNTPTPTNTSTPTNTPTNTPTQTPTSTPTQTPLPANCQAVAWTNLTGVTASGNTLTKSGTSAAWDSGASSTKGLWGGTGYVQMTADSTTGYKMFGLGVGDSDAGYTDIDFNWELQDGGGTRIYENGTLKYDQPTSYTAGDVFKVAVEYDSGSGHNVVRWSKNGTVYYTESSPSLSYPLLLDTSIYTPGAKVNNAYLCGDAIGLVSQAVGWQNLTGVTASGNTLTKSATSTAWDSGASSVNTIDSSASTGYGQMTADSTTGYKMFGLGIGDSSAGYADIDFAWELQDGGGTRIYENGTLESDQPTTYKADDVFKVALEYDSGYGHNVVRWYKNGTAYYTESSPSISYPLLLDTSIYTVGAKVPNAYLAANGGGSLVGKTRPPATATPSGKAGGATPTRTPSPTPRPPVTGSGSTGSSAPSPKASASPTSLPPGSPINPAARQPNSVLVVNTLVYLHGDHLGSVSLVTSASGAVVSAQEFKPWGEVRSGSVAQTTRNYTGQQLDGTGLLYYHARYYDPALARFVSPDSIVPGAALGAGGALGTLGQEQNSDLTVDVHELNLLSSRNQRNATVLAKGFSFQSKSVTKQTGPYNPQTLNRYAYTLNNPIRYRDPTGHSANPGSDGSSSPPPPDPRTPDEREGDHSEPEADDDYYTPTGPIICVSGICREYIPGNDYYGPSGEQVGGTNGLTGGSGGSGPKRIGHRPDPNGLHHMYEQPEHNWNQTGLSPADNMKLSESIANSPSNLVSTKPVPGGGYEHTYRANYNGLTIEIKVAELPNGDLRINDGWVK